MRSPKLPATLVATLLVILASASTAHAGRLSDDPCASGGDGGHVLPRESGASFTRLCMTKFEIPPHRTWVDPGREYCPDPLRIHNDTITDSWGDYWTYRGEWVTWSPFLGTHSTVGIHPGYHNWSSWSWPVRTIPFCHGPSPSALAARAEDEQPAIDLLGKGDDVDRGTAEADDERGGAGDDKLRGGQGDDELLGGKGADHLYGGEGSDELFDDQGHDVLHGGGGNDRFSTKDGNHDVVDCGAGEDVAVGDAHDTFQHCEHVYTNAADTPDHPPAI
jgi:hypothetical protein